MGPLLGALLIHCPKEVRRFLARLGLAAVLEDNPPALKLRRCGGRGGVSGRGKISGREAMVDHLAKAKANVQAKDSKSNPKIGM